MARAGGRASEGSSDLRVGAIDTGTNSTRLIVADVSDSFRPVWRDMRITRLGEGVDATGRLDNRAIARTVEVIREYAEKAEELGVEKVRIIATSACRDAANRRDFFSAVIDATGSVPELLSGEREAATAFLGAAFGLPPDERYLLCDIGGGSTELVLGESTTAMAPPLVHSSVSIDVGCVRLTERFIKSDPPSATELDQATGFVDRSLSAAATRIDVPPGAELIGVAGTVTTLALLHLGLDAYDATATHHYRLPAGAVGDLAMRLASMTVEERRALPGIPSGRADVIVGGSLILREIMDGWGFAEILVSESDILDGLAIELGSAEFRDPD